MAHFEAINPTWTKSAWLLICVGPVGEIILAGSSGILVDFANELGLRPEDIGMGTASEPTPHGFYEWRGTVSYDGLDGIDYWTNSFRIISPEHALRLLHLKEPDDDTATPTPGQAGLLDF